MAWLLSPARIRSSGGRRRTTVVAQFVALLSLWGAIGCAATPLIDGHASSSGKSGRHERVVDQGAGNEAVPLVELPASLADYRVAFDGTFLRVEYFGDAWRTEPTATVVFFREAKNDPDGAHVVGLWTGEALDQTVAFTTRWRLTPAHGNPEHLPATIPAIGIGPDGAPSWDEAANPEDVNYVFAHAANPTLALFPEPADIRNIQLADWGTSGSGGQTTGVGEPADIAPLDIAPDVLDSAQPGGLCGRASPGAPIANSALGGCVVIGGLFALKALSSFNLWGIIGGAFLGCVVGGVSGAAYGAYGPWLACGPEVPSWVDDVPGWVGY